MWPFGQQYFLMMRWLLGPGTGEKPLWKWEVILDASVSPQCELALRMVPYDISDNIDMFYSELIRVAHGHLKIKNALHCELAS